VRGGKGKVAPRIIILPFPPSPLQVAYPTPPFGQGRGKQLGGVGEGKGLGFLVKGKE